MKCPKCQTENPNTVKFCGECGTNITPADDVQLSITKTIETPREELTTGSTFAGRYQIIEELGKGGMGKVYKAIDTEINAKIALKLIKPEIASHDKTIERFRNELKIARDISHTNVCRMYDLNKEEGRYYISMEYVSGEDLKSFIHRSGQLTIGTAIKIAKQICDGLSEAHKLGVIHRDLKSNNIMIDREGNVRIMDFGIARSLSGKSITGAGVMIGTPEYMSPEQVEGKEVDQRSDIYSLGIILYEMVTGRVPFEGDTAFTIGVKHKSEIPINPKEFNQQIPDELSDVILKCLRKNKDTRYQRAGELRSELEKIEQGIPTTERTLPPRKPRTSRELTVTLGFKKSFIPIVAAVALVVAALLIWRMLPKKDVQKTSIAVISFENQTGESSYDYLRKAIPNLLITSLERSKNIEVLTWERMHDLLEQMGREGVAVVDRDLGFEICRREGVNALVLGSFVMAGDMFATDVKVLDVNTKSILRSSTSKGEGVASILKNQIDELSREISRGIGLSARSVSREGRGIAEVTTESMEAYRHYLRGIESFQKFYAEDAKGHFEKAIELDPRFSMAYYYLGETLMEMRERDAAIEAYTQAYEFSDRATEKERLLIQADYTNWTGGEAGALFNLRRELAEKYPKEKRAHHNLGMSYQSREMYLEAVDSYQKALELDPDWGFALNSLAYTYSDMGEYQKAIECFRKYADLSPGDANPLDSMAEQYFRMGRFDEAIEKYKEALAVKPDFSSGMALSFVYALREDYAQALAQLDRYISSVTSPGLKAGGYLWKAIFNFLTGKREAAFHSLAEAQKLADRIRTGSIRYTQGWMLFDLGEYNPSRENLQAAFDIFLSFFPDSDAYRIWYEFCLGFVDVQAERIDSAKSRLESINTMFPELVSPGAKTRGSIRRDWLQAEILMAEGSAGEAVAILEQIPSQPVPNLQTDSYGTYNLPFRRDALARAYQQSGRLEDAVAEYEKLIEFDPAEKDWHLVHPIYYYLAAKLYEQTNMFSEALEKYERFLELWKDADSGIPEVEDAREKVTELKQQ